FEPLGMTSTGFHTPEGSFPKQAKGYSSTGSDLEPAIDWHMSQAGGAGAMISTVDDLLKWNEAIFNETILPSSWLQQAWTPLTIGEDRSNYGLGWTMTRERGLTEIGHNGGLQGWLSDMARIRESNMTIIVLHNSMPPAYPGLEPEVITQKLKALFLADEMAPIPKRVVDESVNASLFDRYVGQYDYGSAVMTIRRDGDRLMAQLTGQRSFRIFPESETEFFWKAVDAQCEFVLDDANKCVAMWHNQGGNRFRAKRLTEIVAINLTSDQLDRFVGRYDYGGAIMTIRRQGDQLLAQLGGQPEFNIFPTGNETFRWRVVEAQVQFIVSDSGDVVAAKHTQSGRTFEAPRLED
ncbi:MAG: serine hydrolase, partial [Planctomycetota bacterium]